MMQNMNINKREVVKMTKYTLGWNNAEYPEEIFNTYDEAFDRAVDIGGQWCITEEEQDE